MASLKSWVTIRENHHFSIANLPFGIIHSKYDASHRPAVAIGDLVLDLKAFSSHKGFSALPSLDISVFSQTSLNAFAALGRRVHGEVRSYLQDILSESTTHPDVLKDNEELKKAVLLPKHETKTHLPMAIGDFTDFFAGKNHAFNVGTMFRGPANALQPNYTHLPVGYHGRSSSIVNSGTPVRRPNGQIVLDPAADPKIPFFGPSRKLDFELELGAFLCTGNTLGDPIRIADAEEHIFGYVLMNDWSARDIQTWEYIPLGPFNAKNFATTISPWVVLAGALEPYKTHGIPNTNQLFPYLKETDSYTAFDIKLSVELTTAEESTSLISQTNAKWLLWSFPQMLAHHSAGGCAMRTGDLLGSGTISGEGEKELGSMLEMSQGGNREIWLRGMEVRRWLLDGDTVTLSGYAGEDEARVGFGECVGRVESAVIF
ncbi:hypothetical protein BJ878DRAFT_533592 [Calycina marina]|uniref:Fumarylacetoacetase n=1 Tax=Calycina marina TaxID=1763456 RepID=A0A9P7Z5T4_9HELO|nr:hypothetical protein BJ878DRAFT_533592 [Calycina marina]